MLALILLGRVRGADDVVMMSPYEITAQTVEFKGWTKLRSPNFIVYTDASLKEVRPIIRQMEMLHLVAQVTFGRRPLSRSPALIVLPTLGSDWRKLRSKGEVEWRVAVSSLDWFQAGSVVEYDWQDRGINVLWASLTRNELNWMNLSMPLALNNGFAYYFETCRPSKGGLRVGDGNLRVQWMRDRSSWLEWDELFSMTTTSSTYTRDTNAVHYFNGQAALFVHFMMTREEPGRLDQLLRWAALLRAGVKPTEARFQSVFGMTWKECNERLSRFMNGEKFNVKLYSFPPEALDFVVTELEVKTQEMRDLFVLIQICNQKVPASEESLNLILGKELASPALRPLLVEACRGWKRDDEAMAQLRLMIEEGQVSREVFDLGTHLLFEQSLFGRERTAALVAETLLTTTLDAPRVDELRQWSRLALHREPHLTCVGEMLCWTEALAPAVDAGTLATIKAQLAAIEGNGDTDGALAAFAVAAHRTGETDRARRACEALISSDFTGEAYRLVAERLLVKMGFPVPPRPPEPELVLPEDEKRKS